MSDLKTYKVKCPWCPYNITIDPKTETSSHRAPVCAQYTETLANIARCSVKTDKPRKLQYSGGNKKTYLIGYIP